MTGETLSKCGDPRCDCYHDWAGNLDVLRGIPATQEPVEPDDGRGVSALALVLCFGFGWIVGIASAGLVWWGLL